MAKYPHRDPEKRGLWQSIQIFRNKKVFTYLG